VNALTTSATADNFAFMFSFPFLLLNCLPVQSNVTTRNEKRFSGDPFGIIGSEERGGPCLFSSAAKTLRVEVSKNSSTALSSHEGAFVTSTTICAPVSASVKPFQVIESMPLEGDAATTS